MRRRISAVLMMLLLCLLCACSSRKMIPMQAPVDYRAALLNEGGCRFTLEGTTEIGRRVYEYALQCRCSTDGWTEVTVLAPASIAGIKARTDVDGGTLEYEDTFVSFGRAEDERLSPVSSAATLIRAWTEGEITSAGWEDDELLVTYQLGYDEQKLLVETRFDPQGVPQTAEFVFDGIAVSRFVIKDYSYDTGGNDETTEEDLG